jgi:RNA polymerase sigma-70 factor (ECF subfamily)
MFGHTEAHDQYLAQRVFAQQDRQAFGELFDRYYTHIYRFLCTKLPTVEDASDIAADVFAKAWEYMTTNGVDYPKAFFFRLARNLTIDFYRKRSHKPQFVDLDDAVLTPDHNTLLDRVMLKQEHAEFLAALKKIKREYQYVLTLRFIDQLELAEIAELLGKGEGAIRVLIFRAKQALKKIYVPPR